VALSDRKFSLLVACSLLFTVIFKSRTGILRILKLVTLSIFHIARLGGSCASGSMISWYNTSKRKKGELLVPV